METLNAQGSTEEVMNDLAQSVLDNQGHPDAALRLLRLISNMLRTEEPLPRPFREYLADRLGRIGNGEDCASVLELKLGNSRLGPDEIVEDLRLMAAIMCAFDDMTWNAIDEALRDFYGGHKDRWRKLRKQYERRLFGEMEAFSPLPGHRRTKSHREQALRHVPSGLRKIIERRFPYSA
jgi:hypothetical protein